MMSTNSVFNMCRLTTVSLQQHESKIYILQIYVWWESQWPWLLLSWFHFQVTEIIAEPSQPERVFIILPTDLYTCTYYSKLNQSIVNHCSDHSLVKTFMKNKSPTPWKLFSLILRYYNPKSWNNFFKKKLYTYIYSKYIY